MPVHACLGEISPWACRAVHRDQHTRPAPHCCRVSPHSPQRLPQPLQLSRGRRRECGADTAELPAHACRRARLRDYISLFPSQLEHRKPLCHSFTLGLHWYLINSIKQPP